MYYKLNQESNLMNITMGIGDWGLGIGDWGWGLGIGDWAQSPIPNPQSPIPILLDIFWSECYGSSEY